MSALPSLEARDRGNNGPISLLRSRSRYKDAHRAVHHSRHGDSGTAGSECFNTKEKTVSAEPTRQERAAAAWREAVARHWIYDHGVPGWIFDCVDAVVL